MAGVRIRALTTPRLIKLTSTRCRSARQLNIGRRSTYQGGDSVQTTGATSVRPSLIRCSLNIVASLSALPLMNASRDRERAPVRPGRQLGADGRRWISDEYEQYCSE